MGAGERGVGAGPTGVIVDGGQPSCPEGMRSLGRPAPNSPTRASDRNPGCRQTARVLTNPIFPTADGVVTNRQTDSKLSRLRLAYVIVIATAVW